MKDFAGTELRYKIEILTPGEFIRRVRSR